MPVVSLTDLQQQIAQRERELQALRQQLESRQSHLRELTRRKEELQRQLQQIEEEITALATATPPGKAQPEAAVPAPVASLGRQPRLGELIVSLLREAGGPRTARQLCEEAQRRGHPLTSQKPIKSVEARLQDLKSQGVVRRASGQPGYLLTAAAHRASKDKGKPGQTAQTNTPKAANTRVKPGPATTKRSAKGSASSGAAKPGRRGGQPPLRVVLTSILKSSRKPLSGRELAQRALVAGYKTESTQFVDSVWTALGQMDNVEHLPQKGYRLKKT